MAIKYLYAVHAPAVGRVKIGISAHPHDRLRNLQTSCPVELVMVGCREGTVQEERALHIKHAKLRRIGEWFDEAILSHVSFDDPPVNGKRGRGGIAAGTSMKGTPITEREIKREYDDKKRAKLIELGHEWFADHGEPPRAKDWKNVSGTKWPSYLTCIRVFGSWDDYIIECGWEPRGRGRPIR